MPLQLLFFGHSPLQYTNLFHNGSKHGPVAKSQVTYRSFVSSNLLKCSLSCTIQQLQETKLPVSPDCKRATANRWFLNFSGQIINVRTVTVSVPQLIKRPVLWHHTQVNTAKAKLYITLHTYSTEQSLHIYTQTCTGPEEETTTEFLQQLVLNYTTHCVSQSARHATSLREANLLQHILIYLKEIKIYTCHHNLKPLDRSMCNTGLIFEDISQWECFNIQPVCPTVK